MEQQLQQRNEVIQRIEQWHRIRLGKMTSSKWHLFDVKNSADDSPSVGVKTYIRKLLWQLITGHDEGEMNVYALKFGTEWEPFAAKEVEKRYNSEYFIDEFIQHPTLPYYGGSADGFITITGIDTTTELKCPTGDEHLQNIKLLKDIDTCKKEWPEIYAQCQSNMNLQGTKMALAVSFQHEAGDIMYKDLMLPRNDEYIAEKMAKMANAWEYMQKEAKEYGIDILAKYAEYSQPVQSVLHPIEDNHQYAKSA